MTTVATLTANLDANTAAFEAGMKKAEKSMLSFGNVFKVTFESEAVRGAIDHIVDGLKDLTLGQAAAIEKTANMARSLGSNIAEFQGLSEVAKEVGVDQAGLARDFGNTEKALIAAAQGAKAPQAAFQTLKLSVSDLLKLNPDKQFETIATAIGKVKNPTERSALAMQIWAKNGRDIIPMLADFKTKLDEAEQFQKKFNITLSDIDANKVSEAATTMDKVKEAAEGFGKTIVVYLSPLVTELGNDLLNAGVDGQTFSRVVVGAVEVVAGAIDAVRATVLGLGTLMLEIPQTLEAMISKVSGKIADFAYAGQDIPKVGEKLKQVGDALSAVSTSAANTADDYAKGIAEANKEAEGFQSTMDAIKKIQADADERAKNAPKLDYAPGAGDIQRVTALNAALEHSKELLRGITIPAAEYKRDLADLSILYKSHVITLAQYNEALDKLKLKMLQGDQTMEGGFARGLLKVKQEFSDVGSLVESTVIDGFKGAEDALVNFATTGKLKLSDLFNSIVSDLARIEIRANITGPLAAAFSSADFSGGLSGIFSNLFGGNKAGGGPLMPGKWYMAGERGPEPIWGGSDGAFATGYSPSSGDGGMSVTVINNTPSRISTQKAQGPSGPELRVMVDQMVSDVLSDPRSQASKTNRAVNGVAPILAGR